MEVADGSENLRVAGLEVWVETDGRILHVADLEGRVVTDGKTYE
jgi:hypothetical protein